MLVLNAVSKTLKAENKKGKLQNNPFHKYKYKFLNNFIYIILDIKHSSKDFTYISSFTHQKQPQGTSTNIVLNLQIIRLRHKE